MWGLDTAERAGGRSVKVRHSAPSAEQITAYMIKKLHHGYEPGLTPLRRRRTVHRFGSISWRREVYLSLPNPMERHPHTERRPRCHSRRGIATGHLIATGFRLGPGVLNTHGSKDSLVELSSLGTLNPGNPPRSKFRFSLSHFEHARFGH